MRPGAGTFDALIEVYRASPEWRGLSDASRGDYGRYLDEISRIWGDLRVADLEPSDVLALRDRRCEKPAAANYLLRVLSLLISWGVPRGYRSDNPCEHVRKLKIGEGWQPWPWEMIERLRDGAPAELWHAAALALYTGQRQRDVLVMKWSDVAENQIAVHQSKTKLRLSVPLHRDLVTVLAEVPRRSVYILTNTRGVPWTQTGFKSSWGKMCDRIGISDQLVFHGLRKSAVVMLLEAGCTTAEVAAITGQSMQMVEHYAKQVNQRMLAASAILKWENAR
jgi:integrase